jgi:hypothetical protein
MANKPKFGPPRVSNPAAPAKSQFITAAEAEAVLDKEQVVTNDTENEEDQENTEEDEDIEDEDIEEGEENEDEIEDKPTKPAKVVDKGETTKGSNLNKEQQAALNEIKELGKQHGRGLTSLIAFAEKMVTFGAEGTFESSHLKALYIQFRESSNTAAGKNKQISEDDHTVNSNTSKLRAFFKVGEHFKTDGWSKMLSRARDIHVGILRSDDRAYIRSKALLPTYEALVKVARDQMKTERDPRTNVSHRVYPNLLTDAEIREIYIDPNKVERELTVEDVIKNAIKSVQRVIKGKVVGGETKREGFPKPNLPDGEDDGSVNRALDWAYDYMRMAGERYRTGFIKDLEAEEEAARVATEERAKKKAEKEARELAEAQAKKDEKARKAQEKAAEAALAKEAAA